MELLNRVGLYLDDHDDLRIIDPETHDQSVRLRDQLKNFLPSVANFHQQLKAFIRIMVDIEKLTSTIRLKALASSNSLGKSTALSDSDKNHLGKHNEEHIDPAMKDLIRDKSLILNRLNAELIVTSNHLEDQKQLIHYLESII